MRSLPFFIIIFFLSISCSGAIKLNRLNGTAGPNSPKQTADGVVFSLYEPAASVVMIAGTFNGWNNLTTPLARNTNGLWTVTLPLRSGTKYQYKFVVDGYWIADPDNPVTVSDGGSGVNSVILVK